ncbi:thiamine-phosphate pyrophosphorylase [Nitratifractor sp.]|uniref:thiamine-phosphate pyrophosphorylase n=1 Tax=Nitratifractor sp. TaxID=2268144 RepID=UPI0025DC0018|nr:thiamine-phosphate pyrophosphorylase [Nitratifractor sp.]
MTDVERAKVQRIIDANLNRLKEGLRVLEDLNRYLWDDAELGYRFKALRHEVAKASDPERLRFRDIRNDVQKQSVETELQRESLQNVVAANFSRTQESSRVLEELFKLESTEDSERFKNIRYELYDLEKILHQKCS